jgi:hypothetical protein
VNPPLRAGYWRGITFDDLTGDYGVIRKCERPQGPGE